MAATTEVQRNTDGQISIAEEAQESFDALFESIRGISQNVQDQSSSVEETSTAVEELAESVTSVSGASEHASRTATELAEVAKTGGGAIKNAIEAIQSIQEASERVSNIVEIISDLTQQTNLLSVNAAIEAAHAGAEGSGFAVVAAEVKRLAEDEGSQASQIFTQMDEMADTINRGVSLSDDAGNALRRISEDIEKTVALIENISGAMREQTTGAEQIVRAVTAVVNTTHEIRARANAQSEQGEKIHGYMGRLVEVSSAINGATHEQVLGNREVSESIKKVFDEAEKNSLAISTLQREIGRFKLQRTVDEA